MPLAWSLAGFLSAPSNGLGQASPQARQEPPVFGTGVELVRLDVVVLDKDGRPVTGCSREDFVVEEEGRRQTVESFEPVIVRGGRPGDPPTSLHGSPIAGFAPLPRAAAS